MPTVIWRFVLGLEEPVVWLDLLKFDEAWRGTDGYVGVGGAGSKHGSRYQRVGAFIRTFPELWHPHLTLNDDRLEFTDGRHRLAWLRDHGAEAVPVTTSPSNADGLRELFGTDVRVTRYR